MIILRGVMRRYTDLGPITLTNAQITFIRRYPGGSVASMQRPMPALETFKHLDGLSAILIEPGPSCPQFYRLPWPS